MNFELSERQKSLGETLSGFAREHLNEGTVDRDTNGPAGRSDFRAVWSKAAQSGILGLFASEDYGGIGLDPTSAALALEAFGYGCNDAGLCLGLSGQMLAVQKPMEAFANAEQKAAHLPDLISGKRIGVICLTEPEAGSDVMSMQTTALPDGDGFRINGEKHYIGNAPIADIGLVFAKTAPERGSWGISVFLVDFKRDGVESVLPHDKMGTRSLPMGRIVFKDVYVTAADMIASPGAGTAIFKYALDWERGLVFSAPVGAMRRQLEDCVQYAGTRKQFDQPVQNFQSVSNRLADMRLRYETARLMMLRAAGALEADKDVTLVSAMAKLHISEAAYATAQDAFRICGGLAYLKGHEIERSLRDLAGGVIYSGTSDIQRGIISGLI